MIDQTHLHTVAVRDELKELTTWSGLFEVPTPEFKRKPKFIKSITISYFSVTTLIL